MKLFSIYTGIFKSDGGTVFGVVPKALWQKLVQPDENNLITMQMRSMLIDAGQRKILIDTGIGDKINQKIRQIYKIEFPDGTLVENLQKLGYKPEDITDIIHTHLHHDHCGGTIKYDRDGNLVPTFPNATVWVSRDQWLAATNPNPREKPSFIPENILPIERSGKLRLVEKPGELFPNIFVQFHYGHTRGLMTVKIRIEDRWVVFASDFLPTSHHVYEPYIMSYDMCAEKTLAEKQEFFQWALSNKVCIFFQHDSQWECATIYKDKKGHKVKQLFTLQQWLNGEIT